jgi:SSS family solute:Na+ symporter
MFAVSYTTNKPIDEKIVGLTYGTVTAEHRAESRATWNWIDVAGSIVVLLCILAAYLYFTG